MALECCDRDRFDTEPFQKEIPAFVQKLFFQVLVVHLAKISSLAAEIEASDHQCRLSKCTNRYQKLEFWLNFTKKQHRK